MRVILTGGGTGGHVYPALAVLEALETKGEKAATGILFVGTRGGLEEQIAREFSLSFAGIQAGALRGKSPLETTNNLFKMVIGFFQAIRLVAGFKPNVVLATGGYVCVPVVLAARARRIPVLIYLPDVKPGWAIRFLAAFANKIATTDVASEAFLPKGKTIVTGYPVRGVIGKIDRSEARAHLSLEPETKTLLVLGGSRGARSINMSIGNAMERLTEFCQIIHASGPLDAPKLREISGDIRRKDRYHLYEYLDKENLPLAFASADLVVSRSGASTLGELPAAGLPGILIPYPYAGAHQELNADVLVRGGAALKLPNGDIDRLPAEIERLLSDDKRLSNMANNARAMFRTDAADSIAGILTGLAA